MKSVEVIHLNQGECEDQKTISKVLDVCQKSGIDTAGAITIPSIYVKEYDDGDQGVTIEIETFSHNDTWSKSAFAFVTKLWKMFPKADLHLDHNQYRLNICTHACDPD